MQGSALYVYGLVKEAVPSGWKSKGINGAVVYLVNERGFSALVHDCKERPYASENQERIKDWILRHNTVLEQAINKFGGVIPLSFNTIIKKGEKTARYNLEAWLGNESEMLGRIWERVRGGKEYGLRIYYEKERLLQNIPIDKEAVEKEGSKEAVGPGLNYLFQQKAKGEASELLHIKLNQTKGGFYSEIKKIVKDLEINTPRILIDEERDLLLSFAVLIHNYQQISEIKNIFEKNRDGFSLALTGPFPPYSFVKNER